MTFKQKIQTILKNNALGLNSVEDISQKTGIKLSTIYKGMGDQNGLGIKNTKTLLEKLGIRQRWWETGEGEIFEEKSTYVEIPTKKEDPDERVRILIKNLDRMGELNEYLLQELKRYKEGNA